MPRAKPTPKAPPENAGKKSEVLSFTVSAAEKANLLQRKKKSQTVSDFLRAELLNEVVLLNQFGGVTYTLAQLQERVAKMEKLVTDTTTHHTHLMTQVVEIFKRVESNLATITATQASDRQDLQTVAHSVNNLVGTLAEERVTVTAQINHLTTNLQELLGLLSGGGGSHAPDQNQRAGHAAGPGGP